MIERRYRKILGLCKQEKDQCLINLHEDLSSIDLFLVCTGPGSSYTAVRSSVSFFKALCTGLNKPLAGISCEELRDFRQKNKCTDKANSIEMINLVKPSVDDYLDSAPSSAEEGAESK